MEHGDPAEIEAIAQRQERTVDALLSRLHATDPAKRRELVLLADEVGLGKTFVALGVAWSTLLHRMESGLPPKPVLVVTPTSHALFNKWQRDAETFLKEAVPTSPKIRIVAVQTPHELIAKLCTREPTIVVARMSAFEGRLHSYDVAIAATLHALFSLREPWLNVDQRLSLTGGWTVMNARADVDLRRSSGYWAKAENTFEVGFNEKHIERALRRLERVAPHVVERIDDSIERVSKGAAPRSAFFDDVKELARAAMGQRFPGKLPLVIIDEIHNWKNHPQNWQRFLHTCGGRIECMLGLSATPFQLGSYELINLLDLRQCLDLDDERRRLLDEQVDTLRVRLEAAESAGGRLADTWADVRDNDMADIESAWSARSEETMSAGLPSRLDQAIRSATNVEKAHQQLMESLRPFLVRHRRDTRHRRWRVGCDADAPLQDDVRCSKSLAWRPGLDVSGDGELVHYLMMRAMQETKGGKGATSLGSDLGGSYKYFRSHELKRLQDLGVPSAQPYIDLVDLAVGQSMGEAHPKVRVTTERAFKAWLQGEKTLVFCFNPLTVEDVRAAITDRIHRHERDTLTIAFGCTDGEYPKRLENFQKRLYNYGQSVFLLFQDHPLAGPTGRLRSELALQDGDIEQIAHKLAAAGAPKHRSRFDRRRVLAAAEQVLVSRWQSELIGTAWLATLFAGDSESARSSQLSEILSSDWPSLRRSSFEGVQRDTEGEPFPDDDEVGSAVSSIDPLHINAWREVLVGSAGRAVLAPYLDDEADIPSLLTRWHCKAMHVLPTKHRALATRMLRRMVRSPGFLTRFLLNDPDARPALSGGDDETDHHWTAQLHSRWTTPPAGGESAEQRFNAYLDTLRKVVGLDKGLEAYEEAARNRDLVSRITGAVSNFDRDRHFTGFNTPLVPEILIVTSVGQEGIDLHRECRHVIHHDLPWNPATLEQRTGRVDRIGSKAERLAGVTSPAGCLDVVVPYIANTYDEFRFRRVHARAHLFEVTMGANYVVETETGDGGQSGLVVDDVNVEDGGNTSVPLPDVIAEALRMRLEAE